MKKTDKGTIIDVLSEKIANSSNFYLADISDLNADATYKLRKACFEKKITLQVVKNSLLRKALEKNHKMRLLRMQPRSASGSRFKSYPTYPI